MNGGIVFFLLVALVAVGAALGMLFSRNTVYAAVLLVLNFSAVAVLYLVLGAPFIALAQITVYAGAIMILFLFVIMLLGNQPLRVTETVTWQRPLAFILGALLVGGAGYLLVFRSGLTQPLAVLPGNFGSPTDIGLALFQQYLLPFEVTSVLLLVAVIGVVVLTRLEKARRAIERVPRQQAQEKALPEEEKIVS